VQVALIPPNAQMVYTNNRSMQMILPERLRNAHYRYRAREWCLSSGFVILDNGMFENDMMSNENLIELADKWKPNELVMPDVRGRATATLEAIDKFLNMYEQVELSCNPNLMAVVQVKEFDAINDFIKRVAEIYYVVHNMNAPLTFGIPRRLVEVLGSHIRVTIAAAIRDILPQSEVHLLGYARNGIEPRLFNEVSLLHNLARSIDTDAPFVWAHYGAVIADAATYERPANYENLIQTDRDLIEVNIKTLDGWAHA
jgi:hypothetical protein